MPVILCPTRGGKSSVSNQKYAINLAKERDAHLIFLYVSNVHFLDNLASPLLVDVADELDEMGEFLLAMAQDRARKAGLEAEIVVRQGVFREALAAVISERNVDTVIIGASEEGAGVTTQRYLAILAGTVREKGVEMLVVQEGHLVQTFQDPDGEMYFE